MRSGVDLPMEIFEEDSPQTDLDDYQGDEEKYASEIDNNGHLDEAISKQAPNMNVPGKQEDLQQDPWTSDQVKPVIKAKKSAKKTRGGNKGVVCPQVPPDDSEMPEKPVRVVFEIDGNRFITAYLRVIVASRAIVLMNKEVTPGMFVVDPKLGSVFKMVIDDREFCVMQLGINYAMGNWDVSVYYIVPAEETEKRTQTAAAACEGSIGVPSYNHKQDDLPTLEGSSDD